MPQDDTPPPDMPRAKRVRTPQTVDLTAQPGLPAGGEPATGHGAAVAAEPGTARPADWSKSSPDADLAATIAATAEPAAATPPPEPAPLSEPAPGRKPATSTTPASAPSHDAARSILPAAIVGLLAGAAAGAAVTLWWPRANDTGADAGAAQIAELQRSVGNIQTGQAAGERRIADLEKRPIADQAGARKAAEVEERIAPLAALPARIDALEKSAKGGDDRIAAGLNQRIDGLDRAIAGIQAKPGSAPLAQAAGRLALIARIEGALQAGAPFRDDLALLANLGAPSPSLQALQAAADGLPRPQDLAAELPRLAEPAAPDAAADANAGLLDRLKASAADLVRVRRADEPAGDPRATIEAALKAGRTQGALAAIEALPASNRPAFAPLAERLQARQAAHAALAALAAEAAGVLRSQND